MQQLVIVMVNDELKIYRGEDFVVSDHIVIHQPTLSEICDYGERNYYNMIYQLTSTPQSMKSQLWDIGIDYTKLIDYLNNHYKYLVKYNQLIYLYKFHYTEITPYQLFYNFLYKIYPQEQTSIIFGDLDLTNFQVMQRKDDKSIALCQYIDNDLVIIDEFTYNMIVDYLRAVHNIEKDERMPANESTKMILIEDDRDAIEINQRKEYHSQLKNLISSMINCEGFKYNHSQVWDMKINAFMDSVKRVSKIKNANLLLQSGYSGFGINLKDVDKKQLNWLGELD